MDKEDKRRAVNPIVKKKHVQILEECERRLQANNKYCQQNNCSPSEYMCGQNEVLSDLIVFINRL